MVESTASAMRGAGLWGQVTLLLVAVLVAWLPAETHARSGVLVAAAVLALVPWGWGRTRPAAALWGTACAVAVLGGLVLSVVSGWDPARGVGVLALAGAVSILAWLASRETPPGVLPAALALALAALAVWGAWQAAVGLERAQQLVGDLPSALQGPAAERLASGRAFASLPLPSHFGVLMATALPLLLARSRLRWSCLHWLVGSGLCVLGLVLARSPIALLLALGGTTVLLARGGGRWRIALLALLGVCLAAVVLWRSDVRELEPVRLRIDNWRTVVWTWSGSPIAGVGLGGFAQASQAVPFQVGNRPVHAHCLPLEMMVELGPAGLAAFVLLAVWLLRLFRDVWPRAPDLAVAVMIVPLHNLADFSLYVSGVALPWAVLVGWAAALRRPAEPPRHRETRGRVVLVAAAGLALVLSVLHATSVEVERAALAAEAPRQRLERALRASRLAPWRVKPLAVMAAAAIDADSPDDLGAAADRLRCCRWLRPRSAAWASLSGRVALRRGTVSRAVTEAWAASHEQPFDERLSRELDGILEWLGDGGDETGR